MRSPDEANRDGENGDIAVLFDGQRIPSNDLSDALTARIKKSRRRPKPRRFVLVIHGADRGGRLYCTAMASLILEIYLGNLTVHREMSVEREFALE